VDPSSHCLCGANGEEAHIGDCNGDVLTWTAWESTTTLPTENGYWYLADNVTLSGDNRWKLGKTDNSALYLDLNGKTVTYSDDIRAITVYRDATVDTNVVITDSSVGHTGTIVNNYTADNCGYRGSVLYMYTAGSNSVGTMSIYRTTIDAEAVTCTTGEPGTAISVEKAHTLNLYGVTVKGGTSTENTGKGGGAIYNSEGTVNIADGSVIIGGQAATAGAIGNTGTLTITDSEVTMPKGKTVASNGGAIRIRSGAVTIINSTITGAEMTNSSTGNGSAIHIHGGSLRLVDSTVYGAKTGAFGGALSLAGSSVSVTMEGGLIKGGNASGGCAVNIADAGGSFTMKASEKGEPVIDATGCTAASYGAAVHVSSWNTTVNKSSFTMECGEIKGGTVTGNGGGGGAVFVQGGGGGTATFTMNGGTISGGKITDAANTKGGGNVRLGGTGTAFNMNGGTITGGETANGKGGGVYVSAGNTFQISGNAKISGNVANDLFVETGTKIVIGADWVGDAENAMVVSMADGTGTFATAAEGVTLTEEQKAYFAGNVTLVDNTFVLN